MSERALQNFIGPSDVGMDSFLIKFELGNNKIAKKTLEDVYNNLYKERSDWRRLSHFDRLRLIIENVTDIETCGALLQGFFDLIPDVRKAKRIHEYLREHGGTKVRQALDAMKSGGSGGSFKDFMMNECERPSYQCETREPKTYKICNESLGDVLEDPEYGFKCKEIQ